MDSPKFTQLTTSQQMQNPVLQSVLILIVLLVFGWFVLGPKYVKTNATREQLNTLKEQRANLEADQQDLNRLVKKLEDSTAEVKLLDEAVPLTGRPTRVALLMETYAQNSGVVLTQIGISGTDDFIASGNKAELAKPFQSNRDLATIDISLAVSGSVEQFRNFLILLEQSGRIIDVDTLSVISGETSDTFNLRLKTYAYELAEEVTAPAVGAEE